MDEIKIEILPDGTLKVETDKVSMANHTTAEKLIDDLVEDMGGEVERERKKHHHDHNHGHNHSHGG